MINSPHSIYTWPFPQPDEKVCGASVDKAVYWNYINAQLGSNRPITEKEQPVLNRYLGAAAAHPAPGSSVAIDLSTALGAEMSKGAAANEGGSTTWLQPAELLLKEICIDGEPKCPVCPLKYNCAYYAATRATDGATHIANVSGIASPRPSFADFFCGAGGLSLGFEWAGLTPKIATDIDEWCVATYAYNRGRAGIEMSAGDIRDWLAAHKKRKNWDIDIVTGGVPCQSFSTANRQRKDNDPRDKLYTSLLTACRLIGPRFILIENVSGMLKEYDGVIHDLDKLGYHGAHLLLNAKDYGIPQNRRRVFFIAVARKHYRDADARLRSTIAAVLDKKTATPISLKEAIGDLPALRAHSKSNDTTFNNERSGAAFAMHPLSGASGWVRSLHGKASIVPSFHHKARYNNARDIEIFGTLAPGENSLAGSIEEIMPYSNRNGIFKDKYFKLKYTDYCRTITAHMRYDCNMYIHPEQARGLTAREAARVQSFPDNYVFLGNFQRLYQQIGNAVPPLLAKVLGEAIRENLGDDNPEKARIPAKARQMPDGQRKITAGVMKAFDLCSGIGGFRIGTELSCLGSGVHFIAHSDMDPYANKGYAAIFDPRGTERIYSANDPHNMDPVRLSDPAASLSLGDIQQYTRLPDEMDSEGPLATLEERTARIGQVLPDFDILFAGFPCQPHSLMGNRKGTSDHRGNLFYDIAEIIRVRQPGYFILENVKAILSVNNGLFYREIVDILENKLKYKLRVWSLNAQDYGVPQVRRRVFFVGSKEQELPAEPPPTVDIAGSEYPTTWHLLERGADEKYFLSENILKTILKSEHKGYKRKAEINQLIARPLCKSMHKMHRASQDNYYSEDFIQGLYHTRSLAVELLPVVNPKIRKITPREAFRIQSFPAVHIDRLLDAGLSDTRLYMLAGNAVPPRLVKAILDHVFG